MYRNIQRSLINSEYLLDFGIFVMYKNAYLVSIYREKERDKETDSHLALKKNT